MHAQQGHVTRIDCALDDRAGTVPVSTIREAVAAGSVCHACGSGPAYRLQPDAWDRSDNRGDDVLSASPAESDPACAFMTSASNSRAKGQENYQDYGTRWELELKKDRAEQCARALATLDESRLEGVGGRLTSLVCGLSGRSRKMPRMKNGTGLQS